LTTLTVVLRSTLVSPRRSALSLGPRTSRAVVDSGRSTIDTSPPRAWTWHMASQQVETRLRIADGLLVIVLAFISLAMVWSQAPAAWTGILVSVAAAVAVLAGVTIVVGRPRAGRLVLTRRRWKYAVLIGFVVVFAVAVVMLNRPDGNPAFALVPLGVAMFAAQLFEPESVPKSAFTMVALGDHDARMWKRFVLVLALAGIVLGCISAVAAAVGNVFLASLLLPPAILFLVFAAAVRTQLKPKRRQPKAKP
jgi:hypothetical protein